MTEKEAPATDVLGLALDRATGGRPIPGNRVHLLHDGPEIYASALESIAAAQSWIHFDNYIIRDDRTGRRFADALIERARVGVRVRVLTDWLGSAGTPRNYWERLRREGIEVRHFRPLRFIDLAANVIRNHRKLIVVDGRVAFVGGFCIGDEWAGDPARHRQPWRETGAEIEGPAAAALDAAFGHIWAHTGEALPGDEQSGSAETGGECPVRIVAGVPGRDRVFRMMDLVLAASVSRFWVTDAYFLAPRRFFQSLIDAAQAGVDVRILVPGTSDLPVLRNLTRFGYRSLLRGGVRIFEWAGPMLHAKTVVADSRWVRIGSSNLNPSSLFGNWELDVLIDDDQVANEMEGRFRSDLQRSAEVLRRPILAGAQLGRVHPTALAIQRSQEQPAIHRPGLRERKRQSVVLFWTLVGTARLATFGPLALAFLATGAMFILLPRPMAALFGVLFMWIALVAGVHAFRRSDRG